MRSPPHQCGPELVCSHGDPNQSGSCVPPPSECVASCLTESQCGISEYESCIKEFCGDSFLGYYGGEFGEDCRQAWLNLNLCDSQLTCEDLQREYDEIDPEAGTSPFCQAELQAKNDAC
jgi:hypothetical protein